MVEAARTSQPPGARPKIPSYEDLQSSVRARAKELANAFERGNGKKATPAQIEEARKAAEILDKMEYRIKSDRISILAFEPVGNYDLEHEKRKMTIALYIIDTLRKVEAAAQKNGDAASYDLFLKSVKAAGEVLSPMYFASRETDSGIIQRFVKIQPLFDACEKAFGTTSYDIDGAMQYYSFPLAKLLVEARKAAK